MTQGERVREVRKSLGLTLDKFGERIGLKKAAVSVIENGKCSLTDSNIKLICREFGVNYIWLTTGKGEMFIESNDNIMETIDRIMTGESEFHKKLLKWCATSFSDEELLLLEKKIDEFVTEFSKDGHSRKDHAALTAVESEKTVHELEEEYKKSVLKTASKKGSTAMNTTSDTEIKKA